MAELKNLIVNGVARVNGDAYVSGMIYGTASNAISAAYAPYTNTDRYVNAAAFASTGSNGANGVKMTLTRAGSDTATVVATIPVAATNAAGVVTGAQVTAWNGKQAAISDLDTIRTNAASGSVAFGWGNHANAGYVKSSGVTSIATGTGLTGGPITSTGTMSIAAATLGKIESGSAAHTWVTANSSSALTEYHPLSGTVNTPLLASHVTVGDYTKKYDIAFSQYGSTSSLGFGVGSGGVNRGIFQYYMPDSANSSSTGSGWLLSWGSNMTASFGLGFRVSAAGFIGPLQGNATTADRATLLANATSGSATQPIYISAGKPTVCSGYVVTAAQTASWNGKWTYNEATIKAVKVNNATAADSATNATNATTAVKLAGTSGSTTTPVWINGGVPTACGGTVITDAERKSWVTASNRAQAANDGLTTPLYGSQGEQENVVYRGAFKVVDASGGNIAIDIADDEVPNTPSSPETAYGAGVSTKLSIWGGLILNVAGTVEFYSETGTSFIWSENSVDIEAGGTYEFNCIQYEAGGTIYGIITKYSNES